MDGCKISLHLRGDGRFLGRWRREAEDAKIIPLYASFCFTWAICTWLNDEEAQSRREERVDLLVEPCHESDCEPVVLDGRELRSS